MEKKQLYQNKKGEYNKFFPFVDLNTVLDSSDDKTLSWIILGYNHLYVEWKENTAVTRDEIPLILRHNGLHITYNNGSEVITEFYIGSNSDISNYAVFTSDDNWEKVPSVEFLEKNAVIPEGSILPEHLSDTLQQLIANSDVTIHNFPDEEDITQKGMYLKLRDRFFQNDNVNGLGYKILRKNLTVINSNMQNVLTQDMISSENTIYEIRYDYTIKENLTIPFNCILLFNGGSINGEKNLVFNDTLLYGIPKIGTDCVCSGSVKNNELHVEWFGAVGDGTYDSIQGNIGTDNKNAFWNISRIINDSNGGTVIFEKGKVYNSSVNRFLKVRTLGVGWGPSVFDFRFTGNVIVDLNGSTVQLATNVNNRYNIFNFLCCEDCYIKNGNIIGDGRNHSYAPYNPDNYPNETATSYEWCCGINGSGSRVTIENVKVSHCCGDAVTEGGFNGYEHYDSKEGAVIIRNCELSYCGRQGISMHSSLWATVENTEIHHIGTHETNPGFSPMSGIDIEYEDRLGTLGDIVIDNCYIHDTTSWNIVANSVGGNPSEVRSLLIDNCKFAGSIALHNISTTSGEIIVANSTFEGKSSRLRAGRIVNCKVGIRGTKLLLSGDFYNTVFYNNADTLTQNCGIGTEGEVRFYNCQFIDITYKDNFNYGFNTNLYGNPIKVEFYSCYINADFRFRDYNTGAYVKMYNCVCKDMSIQYVPELYAKSCKFINCAGRNIGPNQLSVNHSYDDCSFLNEETSYAGIDWPCVLPFIPGKFDFCKIETSQPIFADNWQTIGMNDNGAYRRCIIDYTSNMPYYGTIKNFTDCTISGIPVANP